MKTLPVSIDFGLLSKPKKHLCVCDANCFSFYFFGWVTVFINLQINICLFSWKLNDFIWSFVFPIAWLPYTFFYDEHMSLSSYHFGNHGVDSILLTIVSKSYKKHHGVIYFYGKSKWILIFFFHMFFIVLLDLKCQYTPYAILTIFYWPQNQDNNDHMAYWLSNTSTLLFLLQKSLTSTGAAGAAPRRKPPPTSLFGRMAMVLGHFDFSLFS